MGRDPLENLRVNITSDLIKQQQQFKIMIPINEVLGLVLLIYGYIWFAYFVDLKDKSEHMRYYYFVRDFFTGCFIILLGVILLFSKAKLI